jgi:hypothetical protein
LLPRYLLGSSCQDHWVNERTTALERVSLDTNTFWVDARRCMICPKCIYFSKHFCYCFSSNLCVLNTTNMD